MAGKSKVDKRSLVNSVLNLIQGFRVEMGPGFSTEYVSNIPWPRTLLLTMLEKDSLVRSS